MRLFPIITGLLTSVLAASSLAAADKTTNFRVGVGSVYLDVDPGAAYLPSSDETGYSLFAEFPQSNHAASRFVMYRMHDNDKDLTGFETQLMWGWGLAEPGFRLYTGPAWHREKILVDRNSGSSTRFFNGWGWQIGTGFQIGAITLDVAATWRDDQDYRDENRRADNQAAGISTERPDVWLTNAMISYRF